MVAVILTVMTLSTEYQSSFFHNQQHWFRFDTRRVHMKTKIITKFTVLKHINKYHLINIVKQSQNSHLIQPCPPGHVHDMRNFVILNTARLTALAEKELTSTRYDNNYDPLALRRKTTGSPRCQLRATRQAVHCAHSYVFILRLVRGREVV